MEVLESQPFGTGWYVVAWSQDLETDGVVPLRYFERDLVLFRPGDGAPSVMDAFCHHMGSHMGHGGVVDDGCLVCPFHGWKWDAEGNNTEIPYGRRDRIQKRIETWPTVEIGGMIWVWYHPTNAEPLWNPPTIPHGDDPDYQDPYGVFTKLWENEPLQPQWPVENVVDQFHFEWVHKAAQPGQLVSYHTDGARFRSTIAMEFGKGKSATKLTPEGAVEGHIDAVAEGLGAIVFEFKGLSPTVYVSATTPIDRKHSDIRMTMYLPKDKAMDGGEMTPFAEATWNEIVKQLVRDLEIWRHWRYTPRSAYTPEEKGPYTAIRTWAEPFYRAPDGYSEEVSYDGGSNVETADA